MYKRICIYTAPNPFMQPFLSGVAACARRIGPWQIDICSDEWLPAAFNRPYEGIILASHVDRIPESFHTAKSKVVSASFALPDTSAVLHDNREIGRLAAGHLVECGYRSFAYYGVSTDFGTDRHLGFAEVIARRHGTVITNQRADGTFPSYDELLDLNCVRRFIRRLPKPIAVLGAYDAPARLLVDVGVHMGLRVPGDMAVMGVDNDELTCETGTVPLTSIDTNTYRMGHDTCLLLDRLLRGEITKPVTLVVPPKATVPRQSTSMSAHSDPDIAAAMRFIYERACEGISVEDVCEHVVMSRRRFEIRFKTAVGRTPGDEIRLIRIERAKKLLSDTTMNVAEISVRCGYNNISGFAAAFKRLVGALPSAYRKATPG
jgi:LacI family transcriptional regulator